jgi:activator of HSP90 ATPase
MKSKFPWGVVFIISTAAIGWTGSVQPAIAYVKTTFASTTEIHQEVDFKANPRRVYDVLLDASQFQAFSGFPAVIQREAGGTFTLFGGQIAGRNVELVPNKRIVQAWRANSWPEGVYSIVKFELKEQGSGTRLIMDHTGFPEGKKETLEAGWNEHYWEPLKKYVDQ